MSHCTPEATLKPKRFEFTLETVITDVFVAQVYWEAVPKTWPGGSKASVTKCVVCAWNSRRSVSGWAEPTSWTLVWLLPPTRLCTTGDRAFPIAAARKWNSQSSQTSSSFKSLVLNIIFWPLIQYYLGLVMIHFILIVNFRKIYD